MPLNRRLLAIAPLLAFSVLTALPSHAADKLRIGVLPGVYADAIAAVIPDAKAQGIDITVTEFTDWTTPNVAVDSGNLDLNFFQHQPFLDNAIQKNGFKLASAGTSFLSNIGLYSLKHKAINDIPVGGKVGLANDPVNQGRGLLLLLQKVGLITLKPGVGFLGTLDDIVQNPKKLKFVEVEGPQLARITGDVDLAQGYPICHEGQPNQGRGDPEVREGVPELCWREGRYRQSLCWRQAPVCTDLDTTMKSIAQHFKAAAIGWMLAASAMAAHSADIASAPHQA
jgi:D-methionine transport system substrate-binding protein